MRFGALVVERYSHFENKNSFWHCRCDCGQKCLSRAKTLLLGSKKTCGLNGHRWKPDSVTGITTQYASEYGSFCNMWDRCTNPNHKGWKNYGGRGVTICDNWKTFDKFFEDMGPKPTPKHTIEREDGNVGYEPMNCRWATVAEQNRNKRNSVYVEYQGRRLLLMDLCTEMGLDRSAIYGRLKNGWDIERSLTTPIRNKSTKPIAIVS